MKKTCGIYIIKNVKDGKIYVGQSVNCEERIKQHFRDFRRKKHDNTYFQRAYDKHGKNNFESEIIVECSDSELNKLEVYYIQKFNSLAPNGYNIELGGKSGQRFTEEMRKKSSEIRIGKKRENTNKKFVGTRFKENFWEAAITIDMKQVYIGRYKTEDEAALAYDKVSLSVYGKTFNYPKEYVENTELKERDYSSKYLGVSKRIDTRRGRNKITWRARVQVNGKMISVGDFSSDLEAAKVRDDYIIRNNLPHPLNFPKGV